MQDDYTEHPQQWIDEEYGSLDTSTSDVDSEAYVSPPPSTHTGSDGPHLSDEDIDADLLPDLNKVWNKARIISPGPNETATNMDDLKTRVGKLKRDMEDPSRC